MDIIVRLFVLVFFAIGCGGFQPQTTLPVMSATQGQCESPPVTGSEPWTQEAVREQGRATIRERFHQLTATEVRWSVRQPLAELHVSIALYVEAHQTFRRQDEVETVRARDRQGVWHDGVRMLAEQLDIIEDQQRIVEQMHVATRNAYCFDDEFWYPFYILPQPADEPRVRCYTLSGMRLFRYIPDEFFDPEEDPTRYQSETAVGRRVDIPDFLRIIGAQPPREP